MSPNRKKVIGDVLIEEFYWNGKMVVYVDYYKTHDSFEGACQKAEKTNFFQKRLDSTA